MPSIKDREVGELALSRGRDGAESAAAPVPNQQRGVSGGGLVTRSSREAPLVPMRAEGKAMLRLCLDLRLEGPSDHLVEQPRTDDPVPLVVIPGGDLGEIESDNPATAPNYHSDEVRRLLK